MQKKQSWDFTTFVIAWLQSLPDRPLKETGVQNMTVIWIKESPFGYRNVIEYAYLGQGIMQGSGRQGTAGAGEGIKWVNIGKGKYIRNWYSNRVAVATSYHRTMKRVMKFDVPFNRLSPQTPNAKLRTPSNATPRTSVRAPPGR